MLNIAESTPANKYNSWEGERRDKKVVWAQIQLRDT